MQIYKYFIYLVHLSTLAHLFLHLNDIYLMPMRGINDIRFSFKQRPSMQAPIQVDELMKMIYFPTQNSKTTWLEALTTTQTKENLVLDKKINIRVTFFSLKNLQIVFSSFCNSWKLECNYHYINQSLLKLYKKLSSFVSIY